MARFLTPLRAQHLGDDRWELTAPLVYDSDLAGIPDTPVRAQVTAGVDPQTGRRLVIVPTGSRSDFESVPRWWPLLYAWLRDTAEEAAVVHDWAYRIGTDYARATADALLYEAAIAIGEDPARAWGLWLGVRAAGWTVYQDHQRLGAPTVGGWPRWTTPAHVALRSARFDAQKGSTP